MKGSGNARSFPLPAIGMNEWTKLGVDVYVHDPVAYAKLSEAEIAGAVQDARMYGYIEIHRRMPVATFKRRGPEARL